MKWYDPLTMANKIQNLHNFTEEETEIDWRERVQDMDPQLHKQHFPKGWEIPSPSIFRKLYWEMDF